MDMISVSFEAAGRQITLKREVEKGGSIFKTVRLLLEEARQIEAPDTASRAQMRALYARAASAGWEKDNVKNLLQENLGTSSGREIVGIKKKAELSRLIDSIGPAPEISDKATAGQLKVLWGKALKKGWERDRIRTFLKEKVGVSKDAQIVGKIDREKVEALIEEIAAA